MSSLYLYLKSVAGRHALKIWFVAFLFLIMLSPVTAQHRHPRKKSASGETVKKMRAPATTSAEGRKVKIDEQQLVIPDLLLVDQGGRKVRFYSDLLKGKTFVLGFFFTNCTYVCPRQGALFSALQKQLGARLGKDAFIVSVTTDPRTDTPERLKAWAARYGRKPGWTLVTGPVGEMEKLLMAFTGQGAGPREVHSGFIFIANDKTERWTYVDELASPADVEKRLNALGL